MASTSGRSSPPDRGRRSSPAAADGPPVYVQAKVALAQEIISSLLRGFESKLKKEDKSSLVEAVAAASPQSVVNNLVHMAAHRGLHETVKYLVKDLKLDVDGVGDSDATPVISAIDGIGSASTLHQKKEYKRVVELLIRRGANPNYSKPDGFSPLHAATLRDSYDIAKLLLDNGADVNAVCQNGTVLHIAVENGISDALVKLLLDKGVDPNTINISGFTPLHLAAMKGASDVAEFLLAKGADINAACDKGTSLHLAAENGDLKMIAWLLQLDADPDILDQVSLF
ncbi:hypothetical protein ACQ4PT_007123 [Festuca glaucescens]